MEGIVFDIKRFSVNDGPGIRTTVFLKGCPLRCLWCHNPESQLCGAESYRRNIVVDGSCFSRDEPVGYAISATALFDELLKERIFMEESSGGVTFSGGEPMMQLHFLTEMLTLCREAGIHTAVDTSGYAPTNSFRAIAPLTNLFLFDIKTLDHRLHFETTVVYPDLIHQNLDYLLVEGKTVRVRLPVIPGINDAPAQLEEIALFLQRNQSRIDGVDLLPYHAIAAHKYQRMDMENHFEKVPSMKREALLQVKGQLSALGVAVTIGG